MCKNKSKSLNKGSVIILLVIVLSIVLSMASIIIVVTMRQYKIKNTNSKIKEAFYIAEGGIYEIYEYFCYVVFDSYVYIEKSLDGVDIENIKGENFISEQYIDYIKINTKKHISSNLGCELEIIYDPNERNNKVIENEDYINFMITSKYTSKENIKKTIKGKINILVPEEFTNDINDLDYESLIYLTFID